MKNIQSLITRILDHLYPKSCIICGDYDMLICRSCESSITRSKNDYRIGDKSHAIYDYRDNKIKKILHSLKYKHNKYIARDLTSYHRDLIRDVFNLRADDYVLVPIPIASDRHKERGYNQSLELAIGLNASHTYDILIRTKSTTKLKDTQSGYDRLEELSGSMKVKDNNLDLYTKIILVDDISTTGATLFEARRALIEYGYKTENIYSIVMAH